MAIDNQAEDFWKEKSASYGGEIRFRSFARLLGSSDDDFRDLSGLIYLIGDQLIFEDFEKEGGLLGLLIKKPKAKFEKTLIEISVDSIRSVKQISQRTAQRKLSGERGEAKEISKIMAAVAVVIHEIILENGVHLYFEIMDKKSLEEALKG